MSAAESVPAGARGSGGVAARRAVSRWSVRMFRREWRQQVLIMSLLAVAAAAAVGLGILAHNLTAVSAGAQFGTANHFIQVDATGDSAFTISGEPTDGGRSQAAVADIAAARDWFGTIDVIGQRFVSVPGRFQPLEYRVQDPSGAYGGPMIDLLEGSYPVAAAEVAVTDGTAAEFDLAIGATLSLDGTPRTVVGIVENPRDLGEEFALVAPAVATELDSITILVDADEERANAFRPPGGGLRTGGSRGANEAVAAGVGVLSVTAVALLLVALLASSGFMVMAQRRRRQLGMMAAIGASPRHLRLAVVANGAVVGILAMSVGAAVGLVGWIVAHPWIETAVGYRVARFAVPWWLIATVIVLGVLAATGAAWWPARQASRGSILEALSGRPSPPRPVHRSVVLAGALIAGGVAALLVAGELGGDYGVHWTNVALVVGGTVLAVVGVLLAAPVAIRALTRPAGRLPIGARLALRDLARFQSRSAAALAAITLVLGILMAIIIGATAAEQAAGAGNLAENQLLVRVAKLDGPFVPTPDQLTVLQDNVDELAESLEQATVTPLDVAVDPTVEIVEQFPGGGEGQVAASLARRVEDGWADLSLLYVGTPELLAHHGFDVGAIDPGTEILTPESGELTILGVTDDARTEQADPETITAVERLDPTYTSLPATFVTEHGMATLGLEAVASGRWLIETSRPLSADEIATFTQLAANSELSVETRDLQQGLARLRSGATAVGMLLALGVLAMTVGLIRTEATGDLRTLTAAGATSRIRRAITATTAAALAALGVLLGAAAAVIVLASGYLDDVGILTHLPVLQLLVIVVGTPAAAAVAGWVVAGREPLSISRQPIE